MAKQKTKQKKKKSEVKAEKREELRTAIINAMKRHIGKENAIHSKELFFAVFGFEPTPDNFYQSAYLWGVLRKRLHELRRDSRLMIVQTGQKFFVLKTQQELKQFENRIDRTIVGLKQLKERAKSWVEAEKWRNI